MAKVRIETYGCTLNQADSDMIEAMLSEKHEMVPGGRGRAGASPAAGISSTEPDVIILNTCTVKGATENKELERKRRLAAGRASGGPKLVIAGCLCANIPKIRKSDQLAPIVTPSSISRISDAVADAMQGRAAVYAEKWAKDGLPKALTAPICRIPINDGCVSSCAFCQTKLARPLLRSYSPKTIVKWVDEAVRGGAREIQLTSQDSGAYGLDIKTSLPKLFDAILDSGSRPGRPEADYRIRLGMINPEHARRMLSAIEKALGSPKFYKFLHVPVQSGSEKVCREMNRDHTVAVFEDIASSLRNGVPDMSLATDIIVGYPTETEGDFQQTLDLLKRARPDTINLSKFSARPGTPAKALRQLPNSEIKRRSEEASAVVREVTAAARKRYIGKTIRVLMTEKEKDFKGRAPNYHQVVVKGFPGKGKLGDFLDVEIFDANHGSLFGEPAR